MWAKSKFFQILVKNVLNTDLVRCSLTFNLQDTIEDAQVFRYCAFVNLMNPITQFVMVSVRL
jgi:hypothetical protein